MMNAWEKNFLNFKKYFLYNRYQRHRKPVLGQGLRQGRKSRLWLCGHLRRRGLVVNIVAADEFALVTAGVSNWCLFPK